jgi:hypothetical protein
VNQIAFAKRAAGQKLYRVNSAHIGFNDGIDLFVRRMRADFPQRDFRCPNSHRQTRTQVSVKRLNLIEQFFLHKNLFFNEMDVEFLKLL